MDPVCECVVYFRHIDIWFGRETWHTTTYTLPNEEFLQLRLSECIFMFPVWDTFMQASL
jgi:hypothetical protein